MERKSFKLYGESDIKLKISHSFASQQKIKLSSKEKRDLFLEGFLTFILLILLNLATIVVLEYIIKISTPFYHFWISFYHFIEELTKRSKWLSPEFIFVTLFIIIDGLILYWRILRRYRQHLLKHIIDELHFIAQGNYDHRIPFELGGDLGRIIDSINILVESTMNALEEERRIEQSKDELITNVSHDLRTPLTSILGYLNLIEAKEYDSEAECAHFSHIAYVKAQQMQSLVDDLFEFTKMRSTSVQLSLMQFDMLQLLIQVAISFELEAEAQGITIDVISPNESLWMCGDNEKLVRVFSNLISNALHHGHQATIIQLIAKEHDGQIQITVRNNGEKIPKTALPHLFDRFYRVEMSRSQTTGGSGLGLAITKSIILLHQGTIYASSNDQWTSFFITLPKQGPTNKEADISENISE